MLLAAPAAAQTGAPSPAPAVSPGPLPFSAVAAPWTPPELGALRADLDAMLRAAPALRGAHAGLLAVDTRTGTVLYERGADEDYTPASTLKLFTGITALARLGRDFTFHTAVLASAPMAGGAIQGDLILRGGGDPLLRRADLATIAGALYDAGLRSVSGSLIVDPGFFDEERFREGWAWDDLTEYYAVPPSALTLGESNNAATVIAAPANDAPDGQSVDPDPAIRAGRLLAEQLAARGITIGSGPAKGITPAAAVPLWSRDSLPLSQLLAECWFVSDNLTAEILAKALGVARSGVPGRTAAGLSLEREYLRGLGIDVSTLHIVDGSGLSRYDAVTPRAMVKLLQHAWNSPDRQAVLDALPVAGIRGSLRDSFKNSLAAGRVFAKSGSMTHVVNLAGYLNTARHGPVTFAFLVDDGLWLDGPPESEDAGGIQRPRPFEDIDGLRARVFSRIVGG